METFRNISWLLLLCASSSGFAKEEFCGTLAIAHRGNSIIAPENTIAAIVAAVGQAHIVEFDVRQCATGELVLMHDNTVDRTTDGTGHVAELSLAQLKSLDAGSWFSSKFIDERIPTLTEALLSLPDDVRPLIHRYSGSAIVYLTELEELDTQGAIIQSFNWDFLATMRNLDKDIQLGSLGNGLFTSEILDEIWDTGSDIVVWRGSGVDATTVQLIHDAGLAVYVWTVNDPSDIETFINLGVDGIISDNPASVLIGLDNYGIFADCFTGPDNLVQEGCKIFDFDCDGDLDLFDFAKMANGILYNEE